MPSQARHARAWKVRRMRHRFSRGPDAHIPFDLKLFVERIQLESWLFKITAFYVDCI